MVVSRINQSIVVVFTWLIEKTNIQKEPGKARSANGLMIHVSGRLGTVFITLD